MLKAASYPEKFPRCRPCFAFTALLGSLLTMAAQQAGASNSDAVPAADYLRPHHLVQVEPGRKINVFCLGHGHPTVLLDSGLGDSSLSWRMVQAQLATRTRVCSFDRAGYGFSDAANKPSTTQAAVDDMQTIVDRAHLGEKIVLVAHSLGGMQALLFALERPQVVAGIVLVDPAYPGEPHTGSEAVQLAANRSCLAAAQAGQLAGNVQPSLRHCLDSPPNADPKLHAEINREWSRIQNNAARLSEAENFRIQDNHGHSEDDRELLKYWHDLDAMPLIVLSAGTVWSATPQMTPAEASAKWAEHIQGHRRLAALSSHGRDIVVPNSTHYIQQIKPQAVVEAVDEVLMQIRCDTRSQHATTSQEGPAVETNSR